MLHAQAEVQSKLQDQRLKATIVEADMAEIVAAHKEQTATVRKGPTWLAALSGSVRPLVTYLIIVEWLAINWAIAWLIIDETVQSSFEDLSPAVQTIAADTKILERFYEKLRACGVVGESSIVSCVTWLSRADFFKDLFPSL